MGDGKPRSGFHVPAQKGGDGLGELVLRLAGDKGLAILHKQHQSQHIALRNDGRGHGGAVFVAGVGDEDPAVIPLMLVNPADLPA